jgi:hypothetical protein
MYPSHSLTTVPETTNEGDKSESNTRRNSTADFEQYDPSEIRVEDTGEVSGVSDFSDEDSPVVDAGADLAHNAELVSLREVVAHVDTGDLHLGEMIGRECPSSSRGWWWHRG